MNKEISGLRINKYSNLNTDKLKAKKILVVDDVKMNRMVVKIILHKFDVIISEVENGAEAVDYLKDNTCDLILMDLEMPVLNGYYASQMIRKELKSTIPSSLVNRAVVGHMSTQGASVQ